MFIAVGSVKGSNGVTTLALGLTAMWPQPGAVLVECDADGGDLAYRFGHNPYPPMPGLSSLAAACRDGAGQASLTDHVQRLRLGVEVVLAPPGDVAAASAQTLAYAGADVLNRAASTATVVADVGRLTRGGPGLALAAAADHLLLVARPTLDQLTQVQVRLDWLSEAIRGRLWLVRAASGRYWPKEMTRDLDVHVAGELPSDRWGAGVLAGRLVGTGWRRLRLPRAARSIALTLAADIDADRGRHARINRVEVNP